ncbi:MAG: hypothetical protein KDI06_15425 [Calditrichaeota bacterium]|nr:hypothetical protein [Calditrichota bacterium]
MKRLTYIIIATLTVGGIALAQQAKENDDIRSRREAAPLRKVLGFADEAVGVLDKGQLQNLTMNYGQITDTRYEDVGNAPTQFFYNFRYPRKNFTGLADDFALFFAQPTNTKNGNDGNVIDGWTDNDNEDWVAKDGSYGRTHYNPNTDPSPEAPLLYPPDNPTTPYLAHSDLPGTWPIDAAGERFWPGYFRRDPTTGEEIEGEFASDRDVYAVFTDGNNQMGNPIGIEVEMMAYSYGRPYADKFQFYEFFIHNKSGQQLDSCYVGIYLDPDCSDHGEEILLAPDPTFSDPNIADLVIQRDFDGDIGGATRPNAVGVTEDYSFGTAVLETPQNLGVTTFHYYEDAGPTDDRILWPIIAGNPRDPDVSSFAANYFHGADPNIDDISLAASYGKVDWVYILATGPFSFQPDEVVKYTIVVAVGETDADLLKQINQAQDMYNFRFIGPTAPPAPALTAIPGDGQVTLYWEDISERVPDAFTGEIDFEGYRLYRSQDNGQTWGKEVSDVQGNLITYVPVAQFDLDNGISGFDPQNPFTYLGDDTGVRHTFVDSNVKNGIRYSYTIVAYDRGDSIIYSLETARGTSVADRNFVTVTPRPEYLGKIPAEVEGLAQSAGNGNGEVAINIIDEDNLPADRYELHFNGSPATGFRLVNSTSGDTLAYNLPLNFDDNPVIDGFQVSVASEGRLGGVKSVSDGFGKNVLGGSNIDSSGSWFVNVSPYETSDLLNRSKDFEIRFGGSGSLAFSWGPPSVSTAAIPVNFEVYEVTGGSERRLAFEVQDANGNGQWDEGELIFILTVDYPNPQPGDPLLAAFPADFPYQVNISNAPGDVNRTPPQPGDLVRLESYRSVSAGDVFSFGFTRSAFDANAVDLNEVRVVPNPYIVGAEWEEIQNVHQVRFMFLPPVCTINIYTINGERVNSIEHDNFTGDELFNLVNFENQGLAFGVYVYVVSTPDGQEYVGKFAVIR